MCTDAPGSSEAPTAATDKTAAEKLEDHLKHLDEVSRGCERTFAVILLACAYSLLTIGNTSDASLVTNSTLSQLPIVNVAVPIVGFYFLMPTVLLAAYVYFQLYLLRLWQCIAALPKRHPDGRQLDDYVRPWLIAAGFLRTALPELRRDSQPFGRVESVVCILFAWWLVPVTLFSFLVRYLARHDPIGTSYHLALFALIVVVAGVSFSYSIRMFRSDNKTEGSTANSSSANRTASFGFAAAASIAVVLCAASVVTLRVVNGSVIVANLEGAELSKRPTDWADRCEKIDCPTLEIRVHAISGASLTGSDLRSAIATRVFLVNAELEDADLRGAALGNARLHGANLERADLDNSMLTDAFLDYAKLNHASFELAELPRASLAGALASNARFTNAAMQGAILRGATLESAQFDGANLLGAELTEAIADNAQLHNAMLGMAILESAYLVRTDFSHAKLQNANLSNVKAMGAIFHCASLVDVQFTDAVMADADFTGAKLSGAEFRDAKLRYSDFRGVNLDGAILNGASLYQALFDGADLRTAQGLTQRQLQEACGDEKTLLPDGMTIGRCPDREQRPPVVDDCS